MIKIFILSAKTSGENIGTDLLLILAGFTLVFIAMMVGSFLSSYGKEKNKQKKET